MKRAAILNSLALSIIRRKALLIEGIENPSAKPQDHGLILDPLEDDICHVLRGFHAGLLFVKIVERQ